MPLYREKNLMGDCNSKRINALTGKVMKASNPKPNPRMVTEIITRLLGL